jgi:uncharacterized membrane protein
MGPTEFLVLTFPGARLKSDVGRALADRRRDGEVAVIDSLVVTKASDGTVTTAELADLDYLGDVLAGTDLTNLIGPEDADEVAETLAPGSVALLVLVEHLWLREAAEAFRAAGGRIAASVRIPPEHVEQALRARSVSV